jgi:ATP-dependent exoDNAse (exonuclease V) beta subunit
VRDILALARALLHTGDRTAWLSVLRAPWCGLTLADLHALAAPAPSAVVIERLRDREVLSALSEDGKRRCARVLPALEAGLRDLGRRSLGSWVRSVWLAIGGPATVSDPSDLDNSEACFCALDGLSLETRGRPDAADLEAAVAALMASPVGRPDARVQIMTIHKAKGLEFDTVILPCIGRGAAGAETQLLYWAAVAAQAGRRGIVLAGHGEPPGDALESWMKRLERDRRWLELGRLAYVAATRARRRLHVVGSARLDLKGDAPSLKEPPKDSLLAFFWPVLRTDFQRALAAATGAGETIPERDAGAPARTAPPLLRLPVDFIGPPAAPSALTGSARRARRTRDTVRPNFDWAGIEAVAVGTVVHAELECIARGGRPAAEAALQPARWRDSLQRLGLPKERLAGATVRVERAMTTIAASEFAAGLLDPTRQDAASELALTAHLDGELVSVKIDRTFVDGEGVRWIVDWKVSAHEGGSVEDFLRHELERYADQLQRYARVMRLYDGRPQKIGLYFPLLGAWREWRPSAG